MCSKRKSQIYGGWTFIYWLCAVPQGSLGPHPFFGGPSTFIQETTPYLQNLPGFVWIAKSIQNPFLFQKKTWFMDSYSGFILDSHWIHIGFMASLLSLKRRRLTRLGTGGRKRCVSWTAWSPWAARRRGSRAPAGRKTSTGSGASSTRPRKPRLPAAGLEMEETMNEDGKL